MKSASRVSSPLPVQNIRTSQQQPPNTSPVIANQQPAGPIAQPALLFSGKGKEKKEMTFWGMVTGGVVGLTSLCSGIGTYVYSTSNYPVDGNRKPAQAVHSPLPVESQLSQVARRTEEKQDTSALIDGTSTSLKDGLWRFVTGEKPSEKAKDLSAFRMDKNIQLDREDGFFEAMKLIAGASEQSTVKDAVADTIAESRTSRDDYYEVLEDIIKLRHSDPGNFVTQYLHDRHKKQVDEAAKTLGENDRAIIAEIQREAAKTQGDDLAYQKALYRGFVEKIVARHAPEDVEECLKAGEQVFQKIEENRKQITLEQDEIAKQELIAKQRNELNTEMQSVYFKYAAGLSGFGVLALILSGAIGKKLLDEQD